MTPQQWRTIEKSLANLTLQEKLALVTRLMQTIQADIAMSPDRTREQFETLNALRRKLRRDACGGRLRWSQPRWSTVCSSPSSHIVAPSRP